MICMKVCLFFMELLKPVGECVGGSEPLIPFAFPAIHREWIISQLANLASPCMLTKAIAQMLTLTGGLIKLKLHCV